MIKLDYIVNDDCIEFMKQLPDKSIDLVVTDPPYLISYKTNYRKDKQHKFCQEIANDNNPDLIAKYINECYRILKNNTAMYMFTDSNKIDFFKKCCLESGFTIKNIIVWKKNNWTAGDLECQFGKQYENILLLNKGRRKINGTRNSDVWEFPRVSGNEIVHQNQKPFDLIKQCVLKHSNENDIVFDGFMGSATTAVVCVATNRHFLGCEIDKEYFDIAQNRIRKAKTGEAINNINFGNNQQLTFFD